MKIVLTGGGSGGHFYPLIAVANKIKEISFQSKLVEPRFYYFSQNAFSASHLFESNITYKWVPTGKNRLYFSLLNYLDIFKVIFGLIVALIRLIIIYPDVIFSKGGHDSVPTCLAAKLLGIPIVLHDSDSLPGRASLLIAKVAKRVAVSYKESIEYYSDKSNIAFTSQPIMEKYLPNINFRRTYNTNKKTILISGGSQGSVKINDTVLLALPELISKYNIIHQSGENNYEDVKIRSDYILLNYNKDNYYLKPSIDFTNIYPQIDLVISRAGSSMFEYIEWELPAIIVPISPNVSRDQTRNASCMQKKGIIKVLDENNFTPGTLLNTIDNILNNENNYFNMISNMIPLKNRNASRVISEEIIKIIEAHA